MGKHITPRGTTARRGYGKRHQELREQWSPTVAAGRVDCSAPLCIVERDGGTRRIKRTDEWDLGHDENDRRKYAGPQHSQCNRGQSRRSPVKETAPVNPPAPFNPDDWK